MIVVYRSEQQRWGILTPFLAAGLRLGQRTAVICPDTSIEAVRDSLAEDGIDVAATLESRQLQFMGPMELPVRAGAFEDETMTRYIRAQAEAAQMEGFNGLRVASETPWFVNQADMGKLLRFEARLTGELHQLPAIMMCLYDMRQLTPGIVTDLLGTHPLVVIGDHVVENELYVAQGGAADEYLPRLH